MIMTPQEKFDAIAKQVVILLGAALSFFHLYTAIAGQLTAMLQRTLHLTIIMAMCFLSYSWVCTKTSSKTPLWQRIIDLAFVVGTLAFGLYLFLEFDSLIERLGETTPMDIFMGCMCIILLLEATRRSIGWQMPLLALIFLTYAYVGPYLPGMLLHRGFKTERIISHLFLTTEGIFGQPLGVSATYIVLFVIFGALLEHSGAGKLFIDCAYALTGKARGGPAKAAVVASGLFGTMSGSAVANVVSTGTFTIPLMTKAGYNRMYGAAIVALASSGGLVMPPIMGAGAFVMSEMTGISYADIVIAGIVPAILFYLSIFWNVEFEAGKNDLRTLRDDERPNVREAFKERGHMFLALCVLVYFLIIKQTSPLPAGFWACIATIGLSLIRASTRMSFKKLYTALADGAKSMMPVATACACSGILIGIISLTGLGLRFSNALIAISDGHLLIALVLNMVATIILGMGVPPTASYIIMATLGAPSLIELGVTPLAAHMFIFYFSAFANVTPPVALASYAAAGIAEANPMQTGIKSFIIGLVAFIVPYLFVYGPSLLIIGGEAPVVVQSIVTAVIGVWMLTVSVVGWQRVHVQMYQRIVLFFAAFLLIIPGLVSDLIGLVVLAQFIVYIKHRSRVLATT